jgi:hypothetical protein
MTRSKYPAQRDQRYCEAHGRVTSWSGYGKPRADGSVGWSWDCDRCRYDRQQQRLRNPVREAIPAAAGPRGTSRPPAERHAYQAMVFRVIAEAADS